MGLSKINTFVEEIKQTKEMDTSSWKEFNLLDICPHYDRGQRLKKADRTIGDLPLITAGQFNNGIAQYVKQTKNNKLFKDSVTIDMFGNCFYQEGDFICDDNIIVIKNIKNKFVGLFLASVLNRYIHFDFKKQFRLKHLPNVKIMLPINESGNPDWDYMEEYVNNLYIKIEKVLD